MIIEIVACQGLNTGKDLSVLNPIGAIGAIGGVAVDAEEEVINKLFARHLKLRLSCSKNRSNTLYSNIVIKKRDLIFYL